MIPPHPGNFGDKDAWKLPAITWDDLKLVCWAIDNWTDTGRELASGMLSVPAHEVRTRVLAAHVGYEKAVPSAFRAMANRLRRSAANRSGLATSPPRPIPTVNSCLFDLTANVTR